MTATDLPGDGPEPDKLMKPPTAVDFEQWIASARGGCSESLGQLAERCRRYLLLVANRELGVSLRSKVGASDVVQETLLTAQKIISRFEGQSELQYRLWLRRILINKLAHTSRFYSQTAKREVYREQELSLDAGNGWFAVVDPAPTPHGQAIANERVATIECAIAQLPEHYRTTIQLRCFDGWSFVQIGELLQISPDAARKLWCRAVESLRCKWEGSDESR